MVKVGRREDGRKRGREEGRRERKEKRPNQERAFLKVKPKFSF